MTLLAKKRNGSTLPSLVDNFFDMDRFFSPSLFNFDGGLIDFNKSIPSANITESEKDYRIEMAVPGLEKKDFNIEVQDGYLNISAEKEEEKETEKKNYHRKEFSYHSFSRSFVLPENLDVNSIDAKYDKGVLNIHLPKKEMKMTPPAKHIKVD